MGQRSHDPAEVHRLRQEGLNNLQIADRMGISEAAVRRSLKTAAAVVDADVIELPVDQIGDVDRMLTDRGLDPNDWVVNQAVVNEWTGYDGRLMRQLKVPVRRRLSAALLQPAAVKPLKMPAARPRPARDSKLVLVYGDDQRPNVDRGFEAAKLAWIRQHQPDLIVDLGDGMDMPTVSGHKTNPAMNWPVQACVNDYASWLYSVRLAAPSARVVVLPDNHATARLRDYQLAQAAALYGVRPADVDGLNDDLEPLVSLRRMLRLDEMGVEYVDPPGDTHYAEGHFEIVPGELVALHGYRTGSNLGKKFLDDYGTSVVYGHAHQQDVYVTDQHRRGIGRRRRLYALGVGCGANVQGGGGFAPGADWQQSCLTVSVHADGGWTWQYLSFEDGVARWGDWMHDTRERVAA